jgi:hypothetical protein
MIDKRPNTFIIGAPKCGTTSLASWLSSHPDIFLPEPKEPNFYAPDTASSRSITTCERYLRVYDGVTTESVRLDASTTYLRSKIAVSDILKDVPQSKFIVLVRNPIEMAPAVHAQLVKTGREPLRDFPQAWREQENRRLNPWQRKFSNNPADFQYLKVCLLGSQLQQVIKLVSKSHLLIVFLEDLQESPRDVYEDVLTFLNLSSDARDEFPVLNERKIPRSFFLAKSMRILSSALVRANILIPIHLGRVINRLNNRSPSSTHLPKDIHHELISAFYDDILLISKLTNRDLSHWLEKR